VAAAVSKIRRRSASNFDLTGFGYELNTALTAEPETSPRRFFAAAFPALFRVARFIALSPRGRL
jgi:hypothetical protein